MPGPKKPEPSRSRMSRAARADRHDLYQRAVQDVVSEIDFVEGEFKRIRRRRASVIREDFCGTANTSCEWVRRGPSHRAIGVDLDQPTLDWGIEHNLSKLRPAQRERVTLLNRNVLSPGREGSGVDAVLAMNFSYWIFKTRPLMRRYFESVRKSLATDGLFFMDFYGGPDSVKIMRERRPCRGFTYVWDQSRYDALTGDYTCHIHFAFPDGSRMRNAFTYEWRLWSLVEIRELLAEAGFGRSTVYLEGDDGKGGGDGKFVPASVGENCLAWLAYIVAEP
ncbi:MAG: class I SAM-dependent methyltransferase [Phycisphaeraceae bacterium]|nr:MAG: class I SAM-dependent methyltransferase [Phycisphaeraceae bacterium]